MTLLNSFQKTYLQTFRNNRKITPILLVQETITTESGDAFNKDNASTLNKIVKKCIFNKNITYNRSEGGFYTDDHFQIILSLDDLDDVRATGVNVYFVALNKTITTSGDDIHIVDGIFYQEDTTRIKIEDIVILKDTNELMIDLRML